MFKFVTYYIIIILKYNFNCKRYYKDIKISFFQGIACQKKKYSLYKKEIKSIETILKYYKKTRNNLSYARIDQIRTISKLNIIPPMNQYDVVGKIKCSDDIMKQIDNEIIAKFTSVDFPQFELWRKGHDQNP